MQINLNQLSITEIFKLSKHIKEKCRNLSSFEEVAQELMRVLYSSLVVKDGRSPFVLARFYKSCAYSELPDDIRNYILTKELKENLNSGNKYLTLLGSFGELDNWKNRNLSEDYKAFPIYDEHMLDKFPMLSAVFDQIGLDLSYLKQTDKNILAKEDHRQYGVFCVENAEGSKLIPKQAEFVKPYSVKSVFGFGGIYSTSNVYAVLIFSRERLNRKDAQLFLSLNPAIKQTTLAHEITGNIFHTDKKDMNASVDGLCDEMPTVQIKSHNKTISPQHNDIIAKEMALTYNDELEMANEYLLSMSEELKASEKHSRVLLENSPVCTKIVDLDFNLRYMSAAGIKALKIDDVTELYGKPYPLDFFPESFKKSMTENLEKVKKTGEVITEEAPVCDIYGNKLWFRATLVPVRDDEGRIDFIIIVSVDINERKRMEQALIQSAKLKSIGTITAGISHELNNLLAIISGSVQLLEVRRKDDEELMDILRTIRSAINDGAAISKKMVKFTKTNQDSKEFASYNIQDLIRHSIDFTKPRWKNEAQSRGINYQIDKVGMKKVPSIMCKPSEIREVFTNIINNALDAMPEGGSISFSAWSGNDTVFVGISDTGEGMTEDVKKNIFDPFFTTKLAVGTGLDMSMAYGIMAWHGGQIDVESAPGKGSTFTLQFPAAAETASPIITPALEQENKRQ